MDVVLAFEIPDNAFFDDEALIEHLALRFSSIEKARRNGDLRYTNRGGHVLYLGKWVKDWLLAAQPTNPNRDDQTEAPAK